MIAKVEQCKNENNSIGGIVECIIQNVPIGLGEPVFDKLDAMLAHGIISIGAIKGIEFGAGFKAIRMKGNEHNDEISPNGFTTNNAGGILGGISNGSDIVFRCAIKPPSSIAQAQKTINTLAEEASIITEGRHDACLCPRIIPVIEAMSS